MARPIVKAMRLEQLNGQKGLHDFRIGMRGCRLHFMCSQAAMAMCSCIIKRKIVGFFLLCSSL